MTMEKELPKGWIVTKLGIIAEWGSGGTPNRSELKYYNGSIPWIKTGDLNDSIILEASECITELGLQKSSAKIFPKGSIIIAMYGATIGKTAVLGIDASTNQACGVAKASKIVLPEFLHYYLKSEKQNFIEKGKGGAQPNISQTVIKEHPFPLPPLPTQHRIVAKLDVLFGYLDALKTRLDRIPQLLKAFRQSVLTQAVTGKLTEEWREGRELEEWKIEKASECCEKVQSGGTPKGAGFGNEGIPFLKVYNIVDNRIDFEYRPQFVTKEVQETALRKSIAYPGDVIMNIVGPPLNKIAVLPSNYSEWNLNQAITLFRTKKYLMNTFLYIFFCEGKSVREIMVETKGVVGQVNISLSQCRDFEIPIPPLKEQQEIVRRVESLFAKADRIEAQYQSLKAKIEQLPQALLAKAFRGELVATLPEDGDARELLEEIKKLKEETGERKKETGKKKIYQVPDKELSIAAEP